jgi:hypothetical protein
MGVGHVAAARANHATAPKYSQAVTFASSKRDESAILIRVSDLRHLDGGIQRIDAFNRRVTLTSR